MTPEETDEAIRRYEGRLAQLGPTAQALGWRDRTQQELRFSILAAIDDLDGKSILDVGCGFGDFYDFLRAAGKQLRYTGVDITPGFLEVARERHPEVRFENRDILREPMDEQFDYVVESGVFNARLADNDAFTRELLAAMFQHCRLGVAANLMTSYVDYQEPHLYYTEPERAFAFAKTLSRFVTLRHDYPLYEFTLAIYRQPTATSA